MRKEITRAAARGRAVLAEIGGEFLGLLLFLLSVAVLGAASAVLGVAGFLSWSGERLLGGARGSRMPPLARRHG